MRSTTRLVIIYAPRLPCSSVSLSVGTASYMIANDAFTGMAFASQAACITVKTALRWVYLSSLWILVEIVHVALASRAHRLGLCRHRWNVRRSGGSASIGAGWERFPLRPSHHQHIVLTPTGAGGQSISVHAVVYGGHDQTSQLRSRQYGLYTCLRASCPSRYTHELASQTVFSVPFRRDHRPRRTTHRCTRYIGFVCDKGGNHEPVFPSRTTMCACLYGTPPLLRVYPCNRAPPLSCQPLQRAVPAGACRDPAQWVC